MFYELPSQPYYEMPFAKSAYEARLKAVEGAVPPGATIIDVGCHDGRLAHHLLAAGRASEVIGIDIHDLIGEKPANLRFIQSDISDLDLQTLGPVDVVLALNVLHHVVARSRSRARAVIDGALGIAPVVLVDMGSFTEHGSWQWRQEFDRYWSEDAQMWDDLFGAAPIRRAVLRYRAMSGGHRIMWQLGRR